MGYFDNLIRPAIVQVEEQNEKSELNFENEESIEQRELAHQDLEVAKALSKVSKNTDSNPKHIKKALNRKAKQIAMEATEHAQKSVTLADDKYKKINNLVVHMRLEKSHNNSFMQKEHEKAGINILEKEDVDKLNSAVKKKNGEKSPYNAVRFTNQEIDDKSVDEAIGVSEKAIDNLEKKVKQSKQTKIKIGDSEFIIDI
ncbi:hypothetical protein [Clostridium tagluense]|uniref:hypothetical protein n=1 Tax=Clostridium tagluense TaxID=360422 RepID=UPI001CF558D2|nr:hypothetical protein [Clostridium tagluense]MCB2298892.1 hypothetical protein [Clostridium tagluense]